MVHIGIGVPGARAGWYVLDKELHIAPMLLFAPLPATS